MIELVWLDNFSPWTWLFSTTRHSTGVSLNRPVRSFFFSLSTLLCEGNFKFNEWKKLLFKGNVWYLPERRLRAQYEKIRNLGDRHKYKKRRKDQSWNKLKKDINNDTGMDVCCCSCLEMKSKKSCVPTSRLPEELVEKYCYKKEITESVDGIFYVCTTCQISIKADKTPTRALKELLGFLDFPKGNI